MTFKSKLITFLLAVTAYLLFAFQWANTYMAAWYANIPEETQFIRGAHTNTYNYYAWLWGGTFLVFIVLSIINLIREKISRVLVYILITDLIFTSYYTFLFSADFPKWQHTGPLNYFILCLLAISIFRFYRDILGYAGK